MNKTALSLLIGALALAGGSAQAATFNLCAGTTSKTMPDGVVVSMWGFALDDDANLTNGCGTGVVQVPGPALNVPANDNTLVINVRNDLAEAISIVIPGQDATTMTPVMQLDAQGRPRVHSFTHETAPAAIGTYTWTAVAPGTYAYQSGTHPAKQVQMGLYGAVTKNFVDAAVGVKAQAYPGLSYEYDNDITLFYSEVDPAHTSTIEYKPQYFLINGDDGLIANLNPTKVVVGQRTLLRLINLGLKTHAPMINGMHMEVIAEDGKAYRNSQLQATVVMEAGETVDAFITPTVAGSYALFDRMLYLTDHFQMGVQATAALNPGTLAVSLLALADSDGDGVPDVSDNCTLVKNTNQRDSNGDGYGNMCDADLDNSGGVVNSADYNLFRQRYLTSDADADFNGDGVVNTADYSIFRGLFLKPVGPSGLVP